MRRLLCFEMREGYDDAELEVIGEAPAESVDCD